MACIWAFQGADAGIRTPDLLFTKQLLCQLSYVGEWWTAAHETFLCATGPF